MEDEEIKDFLKNLIDLGIIESIGYNDNVGEELYAVTPEAYDMFPQLMQQNEKELNSTVFNLWQMEMLDVTFDENGEPLVSLNNNSRNPQKIESIEDEEDKKSMYLILEAFDAYQSNNE